MSRVITLTGLHMGAVEEPMVGGDCAARGMTTYVIDGTEYCRDDATGKLYSKETGEEYFDPSKSSKLLNYAITMTVGGLVGLFAATQASKKGTTLLLGAGAGAAVAAMLTAAMWPKSKLPTSA